MARRKRILIADDDESLVDAAAKRFESLGLRVDRAYDGMSTLEKIEDCEPDLMLLDVNMPGGSGLSVLKMLSHDVNLKSIPVIILTGRKDAETICACRELQAHYVQKSADMWSRIEPLAVELLGLERVKWRKSEGPQPNGVGGAKDGESAAREAVRPRVLCVEDDREFSDSLKRRLEQRGVEVVQAFAGMDAYCTACVHRLQAIILDEQLADGEYVLRRLKENPVTEKIPVIVLTGSRDRDLERRMHSLGAVQFVVKPIAWDELWDELQRHLHLPAQPSRS